MVRKDFNRSYTYLMPMLGMSFNQFKNVVACFIGDESKPVLNEHLFVLHKVDDTKEFSDYCETLCKHPMFVERYQPDNTHLMFVFRISDDFLNDYRKFRDSKYSRMSDDYKRHLKSFFKIFDTHPVMKILNRDEKFREGLEETLGVIMDKEAEVASALRMEVEVYRSWMKEKGVGNEPI